VNATVVPSGSLGFLTLWPDGIPQPLVSTLNAQDGFVTSNMAIVTTTNGSIDAFASSDTQLILDVSDYFAAAPGPTVVFIGDQATLGLFQQPGFQAAHPTWTDAAIAGQTSTQALAAFQAQCISPHPNVCHIMIGLNDILADPESAPIQTNLEQMLQEAAAANIKVVIATQFPCIPDINPPPDDDEIPPDHLPGVSSDIVLPNAQGYAVMLPVMTAAIQQAGMGVAPTVGAAVQSEHMGVRIR
jgi:hypothetical protein